MSKVIGAWNGSAGGAGPRGVTPPPRPPGGGGRPGRGLGARVAGAVVAASALLVGGLAAPTSGAPAGPPEHDEALTVVLAAVDGGPVWTVEVVDGDPFRAGPDEDGATEGGATDEGGQDDGPTDEGVTGGQGTGAPADPFELELGLDAELGWDLRDLAPEPGGAEAVSLELVEVRGPGRVTVEVPSPDGGGGPGVDDDATEVLDLVDGPASTDLGAGHRGTFRWVFAEPGTYELDLAATVGPEPAADGGGDDQAALRAEATYRVQVDDDAGAGEGAPVPSEPHEPSGSEVDALDPAPATAPRRAPAAGLDRAPAVAPRQAPAGERVVIDDGHVDMGPRIVDGHWRVQLKDDTVTPHVWRELADVVLHARDTALIEVPDRPAYAFLGPAGTPYHLLPQAQRPGVVWPGWNTQDPSVVEAVPGPVTWRLRTVDGPGRFVLFMTDSFGDTEVLLDSDEALPQELPIPRNSHVHGNWGFSQPGVYRLGVEMAGRTGDGATLTDTRTLTVVVGDELDPRDAFTDDPGGEGDPYVPGEGGDEPPGEDDPGDGGAGNGGDGRGADGRGPGGAGPGGNGSGGGLASTGIAALGPQAATALALIGVGTTLLLLRRRSPRAAR